MWYHVQLKHVKNISHKVGKPIQEYIHVFTSQLSVFLQALTHKILLFHIFPPWSVFPHATFPLRHIRSAICVITLFLDRKFKTDQTPHFPLQIRSETVRTASRVSPLFTWHYVNHKLSVGTLIWATEDRYQHVILSTCSLATAFKKTKKKQKKPKKAIARCYSVKEPALVAWDKFSSRESPGCGHIFTNCVISMKGQNVQKNRCHCWQASFTLM